MQGYRWVSHSVRTQAGILMSSSWVRWVSFQAGTSISSSPNSMSLHSHRNNDKFVSRVRWVRTYAGISMSSSPSSMSSHSRRDIDEFALMQGYPWVRPWVRWVRTGYRWVRLWVQWVRTHTGISHSVWVDPVTLRVTQTFTRALREAEWAHL